MFRSELIAGSGSRATSLDLSNELPVSLNYNIADVKDPSKRNGSFSKTVKLPGTATNNKFFEFTFKINSVTNQFNANLKTPCIFYLNGYETLRGDLRLKNIETVNKNGIESVIYNCTILGQNSTIFTAIGENKLEDLDFSRYNHNYDYYTFIASWSNNCVVSGTYQAMLNGQGYRYPLINYGYNNFVASSFDMAWQRPALFAKEYWDAIFTAAGKTYTSSFLTDTSKLFCKLIIPNNSEHLFLSNSAKSLLTCYVGDSGGGSTYSKSLTYGFPGAWWSNWYNPNGYVLIGDWNTDSGGSFYDTGNVYNTSNGYFTCAAPGNYLFQTQLDFENKFVGSAAPASCSGGQSIYNIYLEKSTDGGLTWTTIASSLNNTDTNSIDLTYKSHSFNVSFPTYYCNAGEKFRTTLTWWPNNYTPLYFYDAFSVPITTGTVTLETRLLSTSTFKVTTADSKLVEGQPLVFNDTIPKDIKQKDFLMSIIRMFNLYVDEDKTNPNNYIIEPRDNFYSLGRVLDWTDKWAVDRVQEIEPMGELDNKEFIYTYKTDQDYYNKEYFNYYSEVYGTKDKIITNDWLKNTNKTELIFSPTPVVDNTTNDLIIPYIFNYDGTTVKPAKHNIRAILWNGLRYISNNYTLNSIYGAFSFNFYPNVGMVDTPLNPTASIEFGVPNKVYYTPNTYTSNHLYNTYYSRMINEVTDRDSKVVTKYMYLTPQDIAKFRFYDTIFIEDTYYYINKINDFNPLESDLTKVELLKLKQYQTYTAVSNEDLADLTTNIGGKFSNDAFGSSSSRIGEAGNLMLGTNISSKSAGAILSGKSISVAQNAYKVGVISSQEVQIQDSVSAINVQNSSGILVGASALNNTLVNCSILNIDPSVYNYIGFGVSNKTITTSSSNTFEVGYTISAPIRDRDIYTTTNITTSTSYDTYYVSGTLTVTLTPGIQTVTIKNIGTGTVTIQSTDPASMLIDADISITSNIQWESFTIGYSSTLVNFYIK